MDSPSTSESIDSPLIRTKICPYCGTLLNNELLCANIQCKSYDFSEGNRVTLFSRPDYGSGFIEQKMEYIPPYEFCSDEELEKGKDASLIADKERLMYQVKFKLYFDKIVSAQDLRHEIFEKEREVRTRYGLGVIKQININERRNEIKYDVLFEDQTIKNIAENEILEYVLDPLQSFISYSLSDPIAFTLQLFGKLLFNTYSSHNIKFITNSRLSLMPHQVFVAHELIMKYMPRFILADEVGLGKTIEAGIFIKEMISRDLAKKVLIIVPANLVEQWVFELKNKFSLQFEKFDARFVKNLDRCGHPNIFYRTDTNKEYPFIICSLQFSRFSKYRRILSSIYWDIVVFDEAHHLRRYLSTTNVKYNETLAYTLAKKLSEKARSMLLLTATPIQLHSFDLFSLLQLIRPDVFREFEEFEAERQKLPIINMLIQNLNNFRDLSNFQQVGIVDLIFDILKKPPLINKSITEFYDSINAITKPQEDPFSFEETRESGAKSIKLESNQSEHLKKIIEKEFVEPLQTKDYSHEHIEKLVKSSEGRQRLIKKLHEYHFLSGFMFRNRKRMIFTNEFNKRIVQSIEVKQTDEELDLYNAIRLYLARIYNKAMDSKNHALGFVMVILQKLLTSSPPALIASLEHRIEKINEMIENNDAEQEMAIERMELDAQFDIEEDDWDDISDVELPLEKTAVDYKLEKDFNIKNLQILEEFLERLRRLTTDSKLNSLLALIKKIYVSGPIKLIIFTQFMKTLEYIQQRLANLGYKVSVFHGSLTAEQKDKSIEEFRNETDILISTEAGGEGRNFQFCYIIINYDLPWNPMKLEQRIGRIDRIGQKHNIYIYNFTTLGTVENRILEILTKRIQLFEESIGNLEPILANIEKSINKAVFSEGSMTEIMNAFDREVQRNQDKLEQVSIQLNDFVLDKRSFQFDKLDTIIESPNLISDVDIKAFVEAFFTDYRFTDFELSTQKTNSGQMNGSVTKSRLKNNIPFYHIEVNPVFNRIFNLDTLRFEGVFDLDIAQRAEQLDFFALGHPLINRITDFCRNETVGNPASVLYFDFSKIMTVLKRFLTPKEQLHLNEIHAGKLSLFMFTYESEFCGIFIERKIQPLFIASNGFIMERLTDYLSRPHNMYDVLLKKKSGDLDSLRAEISRANLDQMKKLMEITRNYYNKQILPDKSKLVEYNETMFKKEFERKISLYDYKKRYIERKKESNKNRLKTLEYHKPTKRQWENIDKLTDEAKKQTKEKKYNSIINEIQALELENKQLQEEYEKLEFDFPEDIKRLEFYREMTKRTWLSQMGIIILR